MQMERGFRQVRTFVSIERCRSIFPCLAGWLIWNKELAPLRTVSLLKIVRVSVDQVQNRLSFKPSISFKL